MVVMADVNTAEIIEMTTLAEKRPIQVRFIEEMPFNGSLDTPSTATTWTQHQILQQLKEAYPDMEPLGFSAHGTADNWRVPGFVGGLGIIAAHSRSFCGTCNRLRITPQGTLKTCLYDRGVLDLKGMMRSGQDDHSICQAILKAVSRRAADGFEAQSLHRAKLPIMDSMATIGG